MSQPLPLGLLGCLSKAATIIAPHGASARRRWIVGPCDSVVHIAFTNKGPHRHPERQVDAESSSMIESSAASPGRTRVLVMRV
jgi:hypothetical protein